MYENNEINLGKALWGELPDQWHRTKIWVFDHELGNDHIFWSDGINFFPPKHRVKIYEEYVKFFSILLTDSFKAWSLPRSPNYDGEDFEVCVSFKKLDIDELINAFLQQKYSSSFIDLKNARIFFLSFDLTVIVLSLEPFIYEEEINYLFLK